MAHSNESRRASGNTQNNEVFSRRFFFLLSIVIWRGV